MNDSSTFPMCIVAHFPFCVCSVTVLLPMYSLGSLCVVPLEPSHGEVCLSASSSSPQEAPISGRKVTADPLRAGSSPVQFIWAECLISPYAILFYFFIGELTTLFSLCTWLEYILKHENSSNEHNQNIFCHRIQTSCYFVPSVLAQVKS